jgi:hypothetical protein
MPQQITNNSETISTTKAVTSKIESESPTILYLYQPQGTENFVTAVRLIMASVKASEEKYTIQSTTLKRGIHEMSRSDWNMVLKDPSCQDLLDLRYLIKVADGNILIRDAVSTYGINGQLRIEDLIQQTFKVELLESWKNWVDAQNFEGTKYSEYSKAIRDQIEKVNTGVARLPVFSNEFPDQPKNNQVKVL